MTLSMMPFSAVFVATIMKIKKGLLCTFVLLSALVGFGECSWLSWPSDDKDPTVTIAEASEESTTSSWWREEPLTAYKYPNFVEMQITSLAAFAGNQTIIEWIKTHPWIYGVIGGAALIVIAVLVAVISVCCYCCCCKDKSRESSERGGQGHSKKPSPRTQRRNDQAAAEQRRKEREINEKNTATEAVKVFLEAHKDEYTTVEPEKLPEMGSRMQKYWFGAKLKEPSRDMLITAAPVSQKCPLKLKEETLRGLNKLIGALRAHPYLHKFRTIDYNYEYRQVIIVQPQVSSGSLKDLIYKPKPKSDWSTKYSRRSKGLDVDKVCRYGRQILEAMTFLYDNGFPVLGHVQSGNVFVVDDVCLLGGYENTLLGYKTRLYRLCRNDLQHFDVIMFGHLIFEMSCGYELTQLRPGDAEYGTVKDSEVRRVLEYIFEDGFPHSIAEIKNHHFFSVELPPFDQKIELTDHMKKVLGKVRENKAREQPTEATSVGIVGKMKSGMEKIKRKKDKEDEQQQKLLREER